MADTITLPAIGPVNKRYVIAGGAALAALVGVAYWRRYRELEDGQTVYGEGYDEFGNLLGEFPYVPTRGGSGLFEPGDTEPGDGIANNAQWTQAAVDYLERIGIEPLGAGIALGKYLASQRLSATEAQWVRAALGGIGEPPKGGPYTVLVETSSPSSAPGPVTGLTQAGADIKWSAVPGATRYLVSRVGGGTNVPTGGTSWRIRGTAGSKQTYSVAAQNDSGVGPKATIVVTVPGSSSGGSSPSGSKPKSAPGFMTASSPHPGQVWLRFIHVPGATRYRWRWETRTGQSGWYIYPRATSNGFGLIRASGPRGQTVAYRVQAGNAAGWGPPAKSPNVNVRK